MFDTMTMTKIVGGVCGTFLVFLFGNWAGEALYHVGPSGHGGEGMTQAYVIETAAAEAPSEEATVPFAEVLASASAEDGAKVFKKCAGCHKLDGNNGTGPHLDGVVNRDIASVAGFGYSTDLDAKEGAWTPEHLNEFLLNPKAFAANTKMSFKGLPKVEDRAALVAYLETQG